MPIWIGPVKLYAVIYALSAAAFLFVALRWSRRLSLPRGAALGLWCCYALGMGFGGRVLYDVVNLRFDPTNYLQPGYYLSDGLWGGPLAYLVLAGTFAMVGRWIWRAVPRSSPRGWTWTAALDLSVLALPIPLAMAKLACLVNGCCFGTPCPWPWGVMYPYRAEPPDAIARHPTQLYEMAALIFIHVVLVTLERRRWNGLLLLWFVFLYGLARPITEFFRMPADRKLFVGTLTFSQVICLAGAALALVVLFLARPPRRTFEPPLIRPSFA
jgi:prolipoprotein diacylglyceryltransferase